MSRCDVISGCKPSRLRSTFKVQSVGVTNTLWEEKHIDGILHNNDDNNNNNRNKHKRLGPKQLTPLNTQSFRVII